MNPLFEIALGAAFLGGLAGGVHCAGMCGGIVHALCAAPGRRHGKAHWPYLIAYNAGRISSYACAGLLAGALGGAGLLTRAAPLLQPLMFALASVMLVMLGLYLAGTTSVIARLETAGAWLWRWLAPWSRRFLPVTSVPRALGLGALWGWLPCGMVYAVLLTALAMGSAWQGALLLLAFGLGTLPNLVGVAMLSRRIDGLRKSGISRAIAGGAIALFGIYGLTRIAHAGITLDDGLICHVVPGLASWLPW